MKIINSLITIGFLIAAQQAYATDEDDEPELSWGCWPRCGQSRARLY
jgi:hypothetical protein